MNTNYLSIIYDVVLVVVFALVVWRGWRRGLLATLLWLAGWAVALFIIFGWGTSWSESIYTGAVEPRVVTAVEKAIPAGTVDAMNSGADAVDSIQNILDDLGGMLGGQRVTISEADAIKSALRQDSTSLAESITYTVLRPVLSKIVRDAVFLLILIVVMFVFRFLSRMAARRRGSHGVLSRTNHLLGGVLGVLEGMAVTYAVAFILWRLANFLDTSWLNTTILSETFISRMV